MVVPDPVFVSLSASVAKLLVRLWMNDDNALPDAGSDIGQLLAKRVLNIRVRNNAQRQFAKIGEQIVDALEHYFRVEASELSILDRSAVALSASESLGQFRIDTKGLVRYRLNPNKLTDAMLEQSKAHIKFYTENESALYRSILHTICQYVADIASQFPSFTEKAFGDLFEKGDWLVELVNEVLSRVKEIEQLAHNLNPNERTREFEVNYRREIERTLGRIEFFGTESSAPKRHKVTIAYLSLKTSSGHRHRSVPEVELVKRRMEALSRTSQLSKDDIEVLWSSLPKLESLQDLSDSIFVEAETRLPRHKTDLVRTLFERAVTDATSLSIESCLARSTRLLVRGTAGSGKSTLMQWLAVRAAEGAFPDELSHWNRLIPFWVPLRRFAERDLPTPEEFPRIVSPMHHGEMPAGWVHQVLKSGNALVLIDGLDELSRHKREAVHEWLESLLLSFPDSIYVLTSRPHAVELNWRILSQFEIADFQSMELEDVYTFIERWHEAVSEDIENNYDRMELQQSSERLKTTIRHERSIRHLSSNPLLCAMICALHRHRRNYLPKDRIELYQACSEMLLERRERNSGIDLSDYPNLSKREKEWLIQNLAYWMAKNALWEASAEDVDNRLHYDFANMNFKANVDGAEIRRFFVERTVLLREPVIGEIDFAHRTFQEYFAACAAIRERDINLLAEKAEDDQWRNIVVLAAGMANSKEAGRLIKKLVERGDEENQKKHHFHVLALACLETPMNVPDHVRNSVRIRLPLLFPPKKNWEPRELAFAGDEIVPHFREFASKEMDVATAEICVRTLIEIGSEAALYALAFYAEVFPELTLQCVQELKPFFRDEDEFNQTVLKPVFCRTRAISVEFFRQLGDLNYFLELRSLRIRSGGQREAFDLNWLTALEHLEVLELGPAHRVQSIDPLINFKNLRVLIIPNCTGLSSLDVLERIKNLEILDLGQLYDLRSLESLEFHARLRFLRVKQLPMDLPDKPLRGLSQLNYAFPAVGRGVDLKSGDYTFTELSGGNAEAPTDGSYEIVDEDLDLSFSIDDFEDDWFLEGK
jgi:hypothetical protein